jgi:hypothetical protein
LRRHAAEALGAGVAAVLLTLALAAPVLYAPSDRIFGAEIVGRHHDPFTVMQQFARPMSLGLYSQPLTDLTGAAIARGSGPVAAYNWLVLLSFPLSVIAAYLLARHLALAPAAALLAALLFGFSPFHIAQAAYHPHVAQTQWLPLYLLALWRCMDKASAAAVAWLAAAAAAVTLSNFYGGLIAAVLTPIALAAYWFGRARFAPRAPRQLAITLGALGALALAGVAFVWRTAPDVMIDPSALAFVREDLFRFSAKWWSYLVPPVAHPLLGGTARRIWVASDVTVGLLEQQVSLGWSVIVLGVIAIYAWADTRVRPDVVGADGSARPDVGGTNPRVGPTGASAVPILAAVALGALLCSLSPERTVFGVRLMRPSALLYQIVPMFRSYARFGVIVQLMAALLAGIGAGRLVAMRTRSARGWCAALVVLAGAEYAVWPPSLSRDVLPTAAHRWVMQHTARSRVFDCGPLTVESASVSWLTAGRVALADGTHDDCAEPQLASRLWASGFTHLLVRDTWERRWLHDHGGAEGIHLEARFADADVFSIAPRDLVYTAAIAGFWPREHAGGDTWRWMSGDASWTIVTPTPRPRVTLELEMRAFHVARALRVRLDDGPEQTLDVAPKAGAYRIGPLALTAGPHLLTFHSAEPATIADPVIGNGDRRALSFSIGAWKWSTE